MPYYYRSQRNTPLLKSCLAEKLVDIDTEAVYDPEKQYANKLEPDVDEITSRRKDNMKAKLN